ncbi:hypothetical protein CLUG_05745 [Clavispora lusitaniae ATCC 42720]|uniref:Uncharacterized protein n=1 Tax=Clavispora lusitaniae (strain ATCC 42720) TaxID=306902 RepID=C4YCA6_CLAL4|nr:uncharacterized protein CLUG_05745 [Clavispora lusitaniae ATCC 42720]EEQ41616.1 hypothetical protein CLUG_05745 [Clavispora lusitaniae ATCC 42720]
MRLSISISTSRSRCPLLPPGTFSPLLLQSRFRYWLRWPWKSRRFRICRGNRSIFHPRCTTRSSCGATCLLVRRRQSQPPHQYSPVLSKETRPTPRTGPHPSLWLWFHRKRKSWFSKPTKKTATTTKSQHTSLPPISSMTTIKPSQTVRFHGNACPCR